MITANENDLVEPMVLVPLADYEDGIVARTKLMIITDLAQHMDCNEFICMETLKRVLGVAEV